MSNLSEIWKPVPNYEGIYEISNYGNFAVLKKDGRVLRKLNSATHYLSVSCKSLNGEIQKSLYIHRLVALVFIGQRPDGMVIRHLDGNRYNNCVDNLSYGTVEQNYEDAVKHGTHRHENNGRALLTERCVLAIKHLHNQKLVKSSDLAKAFNVSDSTICAIVKERNWKYQPF
jgi:hypothetical protein